MSSFVSSPCPYIGAPTTMPAILSNNSESHTVLRHEFRHLIQLRQEDVTAL